MAFDELALCFWKVYISAKPKKKTVTNQEVYGGKIATNNTIIVEKINEE